MNMVLGGYEFAWNPDSIEIPKAERSVGVVETYSGVAVFSFGLFIAGKRIVLKWKVMQEAQWEAIRAIYELDEATLFIPGDGYVYTVEILPPMEGSYIEEEAGEVLNEMPYREDVRLNFLITAQVLLS
jgi:hypothetical protein